MKSPSHVRKITSGIGLGALLLSATAFYISYRIIHPKRKQQADTPAPYFLGFKKIQFKSADGTLLKGWLVETKNPKGLIILSHGYSFDKQSLLPAAKELHKNGYSSLLFDYRGHGESGGEKTTLGIEEQQDLLAAVSFAKNISGKIGIIGVSMGAAAAIMAAQKINELKALVADSCFAKLENIIYKKAHLLTPMIIMFMKSQGVDVEKSDPINHVDKTGCPVFFIHGDKDELVPFDDSIRLFEKARSPKELWIVKSGTHGRSYFVDKEKYSEKIIDFLNRHF